MEIPPDEIQKAEGPVNRIFAKVVGGVMLWIGVAGLGLFVYVAYTLATLGCTPAIGADVFMVVLAMVGVFCVYVAWCLFFSRPKRFGSLRAPVGWRDCAGL